VNVLMMNDPFSRCRPSIYIDEGLENPQLAREDLDVV
jgi:hypothetical protein